MRDFTFFIWALGRLWYFIIETQPALKLVARCYFGQMPFSFSGMYMFDEMASDATPRESRRSHVPWRAVLLCQQGFQAAKCR